jgi:hydroxymethylpyrimidine pyrophosphatase-like HAD family hydrolase
MKYLILIDSDETLRHTNGEISQRTKDIIYKVSKSGNHVIICTGRPRYHTERISREVGASNIIVSSNGTEIYDLGRLK